MDINRIKIKVSSIFSNLDRCENPEIRFEVEDSGYLVPCEGRDYIEIIPLVNFTGLAIWIKCSECDECGWKKIIVTPCTYDTDCPDCSVCSDDGYCISVCKDTEFCKDKRCVECDDNHPCTNGKICIDGKCTCPPQKPIWNGKECVACVTDEECGKCHKCTSEGCKPKDCICNPDTGDCVECMNSGDCKSKDPNMCCSPGHKCVCCTGYIWSYVENRCIKEPECFEDKDCMDPCKYCDHGICIPIVCPEGYTCYLGDCVKICDCNKGGCDPNSTCIPYGDLCICVECVGDCDVDTDCGKGCKCGKLKKCIPNPCSGTCKNGTECAPGCGCDKDGNCTLCSDKNCLTDECDDIDGCGCNGSNCEDLDSECSGTCTSYLDCKGVNCTCFQGKCVNCKNFSCDTDCKDIPGCDCNINNTCVGSPKGDCTDEFTFTKDGCGARVELKLKEKCSCKDIIFKSKFVTNHIQSQGGSIPAILNGLYILELRKNVNGNPLLSEIEYEGIAHNDMPLSGLVEIYNKYTFQNENGIDLTPIKISLAGKSQIEFVIDLLGIGNYYNGNLIKKVETYVKVSEDVKLPNGCIYKKGDIIFTLKCNDQICTYKTGSTETKTISSTNFVDPLLKIYRTKDDVFALPYRKIYKIPVSVGRYLDNIYGPDDFDLTKQILVPDEGLYFGNQTYIAKNDCSCQQYASLGKVINCEPATLNYTLSMCNSKIELTGFTPVCATNKDLSYYGASNEDKAFSQATWRLYIDTRHVATFKYFGDPINGEVKEITSMESISGWTYTNWSQSSPNMAIPIESIELKMYYGDALVCDSINEQPENNTPLPTHNKVCPSVTSPNYYDIITKVSNGLIVTSVSAWTNRGDSVYVEDTGNDFKVHAPFGLTTTVRVTYSTGCSKEYTLNENCCASFIALASYSLSESGCGGDLSLIGSVQGGANSVTYKWTTPDGQELTGQNRVLTDYVSGTYTLEAIDGNNCKSTAHIDINVLNIQFDTPEDQSVCNGSVALVDVTGTTGAVLEYRIGQGNLETVNLPGQITTPALIASTVITYTQVSYGGCSRILNETTMLTVVANATATITELNTQQCVGANPSVEITGTPGAVIDYKINNVSGQTQIGIGGTQDIPLPNASGSYLVQLVRAILGSCVHNITGQQVTILIQNSPLITIMPNSYECTGLGGGNFVYEFEFNVANYTGLPVASLGTVQLISGNLYKVINVPSGQSSVISVSNGTCVSTQQSQAYNCDCNSILIPPPLPVQAFYTFCDGGVVPTLEVELAVGCTCRVDWYDDDIAGNLVASNSLTYTPEDPGTGASAFYYAEAIDLISGCKSNRTLVVVENSELPNSVFTANPINKYCYGNTIYFSIPYQAQTTYSWSVINGTIQGSNTGTSVAVLLDTIGVLSVTLTTGNVDGCTNNTTTTYTIGNLTYTIDAYDCVHDKAVLHLGGIAGHTYQAIFTNTTTGGTKTVNGLAGGGTHDITALPDGKYTVSIKDENNIGCTTNSTYVVDCCTNTWGATATLVEEGCWSVANGGDIDIDIACSHEVYSDYKMCKEFYINGIKVMTQIDNMNGNNSCETTHAKVNPSVLNLHLNILLETDNILGVKFKKNNQYGDIVWEDANILTFDASDC